MVSYFVRRYVTGVKGSGTKDLLKMDEEPQDFAALVNPFGPGKYLLFSRQKGVRGFRKVTEYLVPDVPRVFAAESVSVKQTVDVNQIPTSELKNLMADMISQPRENEDFAADLQKVYSEVMARVESQDFAASTATEGFGSKLVQQMPGVILGALVMGVPLGATVLKQRGEIDELKGLIEKQSETVSELSTIVKKAEHERKKAAEVEKTKQSIMRSKMGMDGAFLSEYNRANGWR